MSKLTVVVAGSFLVLGAVAAGCGSSGSSGSAPVTVTLFSDPGLDGTAGTLNFSSSAGLPTAGDNGAQAFQGFVSFDLSTLPPGAVVISATVTVAQVFVFGDPYADHGVVVLDHVDYGDVLDSSDYGTPSLTADVGVASSDSSIGATLIEATAEVAADLAAARTRSQFRLRFSLLDTDGDATADQALFEDGEDSNGSGMVPTLEVTYQL